MLNSTIIKRINVISCSNDICYDELVNVLCDSKLYTMLSEVISTLIINEIPEEYVEKIYFFHQGKTPLSYHTLLPELAMKTVSGESFERILRANMKSNSKYPNICKDLFIRYWFTANFGKSHNSLTSHTNFKPFTIEEIELYIPYIRKNLAFQDFSRLVGYGKFTVGAFSRVLDVVYIKTLNLDNSSYIMTKIYSSTNMSHTEKEQYADALIRMNNKYTLLYGECK